MTEKDNKNNPGDIKESIKKLLDAVIPTNELIDKIQNVLNGIPQILDDSEIRKIVVTTLLMGDAFQFEEFKDLLKVYGIEPPTDDLGKPHTEILKDISLKIINSFYKMDNDKLPHFFKLLLKCFGKGSYSVDDFKCMSHPIKLESDVDMDFLKDLKGPMH